MHSVCHKVQLAATESVDFTESFRQFLRYCSARWPSLNHTHTHFQSHGHVDKLERVKVPAGCFSGKVTRAR